MSVGNHTTVHFPDPAQRYEDLTTLFSGLITATAEGSAQTLYTAGAAQQRGSVSERVLIRSIRMMNVDDDFDVVAGVADNDLRTPHWVSLYIVPSGGSIGAGYRITPHLVIDPGTLYHEVQVDEVLPPGATIQAWADEANMVVVRITGSTFT